MRSKELFEAASVFGGPLAKERVRGRLRRVFRGRVRVTAIVSTYAAERFIDGCLADLTGQSLFARGELEVVVIDSGSPEREGEVVRAYRRLYGSRILYRRTPHETIYGAWNRAVLLARGTYLTNANTDDRHHPEALERMADRLDRVPGKAGVYGLQLITEEPNRPFGEARCATFFNWPEFSYEELQRRCILGSQPMWRRSLHRRFGLFDPGFRVVGDYDFWLRVGRSDPFERIPEALGQYYRNPSGLELSCDRIGDEAVEVRRRHGILDLPQGGTTPVPVDQLPQVVH